MKRIKGHKATPRQSAARARRDKQRSPRARRIPAQAASDFLDSLIAANAQALGLTIDPAWHAGVKFNLGLILRLGALVDAFALPADTEPGPVFRA